MKQKELTKDFLERHLEIWREKVSKRQKWKDLAIGYKVKQEEVTERITEIVKLFTEKEVEEIKESFQVYESKSSNSENDFFKDFNKEEHIRESFNAKNFNNNIEAYKDTYFYKRLNDAQAAYIKNLESDMSVLESFNKVGNWKKDDDKKLKYNSGKSKGSMFQYLIIEYLSNNLNNEDIKKKIIKFYDLSIHIILTPHSIKSAIGLHFNVNNNNFILNLLEFFKNISDVENTKWKGSLNAIWKDETFTKFNTNSVIELYTWINLGKSPEEKLISIYNDKTSSTLQILMNDENEEIVKKIQEDEFYKKYKKYVEKHEPYPDDITDKLLQVIYADQFFQYIHELEMEELNKNIIYYGAPGTGKTYHVTKQLIELHDVQESNFKIVQFHPSYGYEDFIEGVKPKGLSKEGNINFELVNGEFKQFCIDASKKYDEKFYFIVDEINRAELSRTFGELLYCFEYRVKFEDDGKIYYEKNKTNLIRTQYSNLIDNLDNKNDLSLVVENDKSYFGIPENVYFIGTMNDIDRSIDSFDMALRRRFVWIKKDCDLEVVSEWLYENGISPDVATKYIVACEKLNNYIENDLGLGKSYQIGHAYFMKLQLEDNSDNIKEEALIDLWKNNINPLIYEYLRAECNEKDIEEKLKIAKDEFSLKDENK
ncbi:MAG: AAA family ATPase [Arcobacteraceae bacterium]